MSKEDQLRAFREQRAEQRPLMGVQTVTGITTAAAPAKPKRGRPLAKDADKTLSRTKPWLGEGMSKATWYRRRKTTGGQRNDVCV